MSDDRKLAMFIDFENIVRGVKEAQYKQFEIKLVLERLVEKGKIMGITANPMYVLPTLSALELTLRDLGHRCEAGAGVAAAQAVFSARTA